MSRTFHHGNRAAGKYFGCINYHAWSYSPPNKLAPPKRKRYQHARQWMREPNWWIHEFHEVSHRARCRKLMAAVKIGDEDVVIPPFKIPHIYFW